jgi:hypothetical protein
MPYRNKKVVKGVRLSLELLLPILSLKKVAPSEIGTGNHLN